MGRCSGFSICLYDDFVKWAIAWTAQDEICEFCMDFEAGWGSIEGGGLWRLVGVDDIYIGKYFDNFAFCIRKQEPNNCEVSMGRGWA